MTNDVATMLRLVLSSPASLRGETFEAHFDELVRATHDLLDSANSGAPVATLAADLALLAVHVAIEARGTGRGWNWRADVTERLGCPGASNLADALVLAVIALGECRRLAPQALSDERAERAVDVAAAALGVGLARLVDAPAPASVPMRRTAAEVAAELPS